jgi:hypothetical protein
MSKFSSLNQRRSIRKPDRPHAIWGGIGCIMIVLVPVLSFALGALTTQIALDLKWPVPYQLTGHPVMPASLFRVDGLAPILIFIQQQNNLYAMLVLAVFYTVVFGALFSLVYAFIYRFVGPPTYGPQDAAPPKIKVKPYKR